MDPQTTLHNLHPCLLYLSQSIQTCVVPLCQSELACGTADLILVEAGHQFSAHFDVGASVAPLLVVIWRWKNCDNLEHNGRHVISSDSFSSLFTTIRDVVPVHCDTAHSPPVCTRGIWWAAGVPAGAAVFGWRQGRSNSLLPEMCWDCSRLGLWGHSTIYLQSVNRRR